MMSIQKISLSVLLISITAVSASAGENHFFRYHLPSPPAVGSAEYDQDFIKLHELQDHRTPDECASADTQSSFTLENGFGPATGVLTAEEVKKAKVLSMRVIAKVAIPVYYFKQKFKRARPFNTDHSLTPCIRKPGAHDYAYPSGHSSTGYALALALSKKFPEKRDIIMAQGLKIGNNRLLGGVHHPSDVAAGRKLAEQVVKNMFITRAR